MEYKKDFDKWNLVKKELDNKRSRLFFREKEIWWCNFGVNVGSEQDGKGGKFLRPILVFKKINNRVFLAIPLTKKLKENKTHVSFYFNYDLSTAITFQIKVLDAKRLAQKVGSISEYLYAKIKKTLSDFIN